MAYLPELEEFEVGIYQIETVDAVLGGVAGIANLQGRQLANRTKWLNSFKAPLASPTFTGIPAAPTAVAGTNSTQLATTAFVSAAVAAIPAASETVPGKVELATAAETATGTDAVRAVHPAGLKPLLDAKSPLASPTFTGTPTAPTAVAGTNTTQLATTAFVGAAVGAIANASETVQGKVELATAAETATGTDNARAVHPAGLKPLLDAKSPLASPTFTGIPAAPTAGAGTNTTQLATTAFVVSTVVDALGGIGSESPASETVSGIVELATAAETATGTDNARAVHPAGLKPLLDAKSPLASPTFTGTPTAPTAVAGTNTTQLATTAFVGAAVSAIPIGVPTAVRQTVLSGPVDASGIPSLLPASNGALSITTQNVSAGTPLLVASANGYGAGGAYDRIGQSTANLTWNSLSANATNYLYVTVASDGSMTTGSSTLAPVYQFGGARSTVNGQSTFNIQECSMTVGNGSAAVQAYRVFVGQAITNATTVTSTAAYAYNGHYDSGWTATIPSSASRTNKTHNIGVDQITVDYMAECTTNDQGFVVGERLSTLMGTHPGGSYVLISPSHTRLVASLTIPSAGIFSTNPTNGAIASLMHSNWKYKVTARRAW